MAALIPLALLRRGGTGIVGSSAAGIVTIISPYGVFSLVMMVVRGVFMELPLMVVAYRRWGWPMFGIAGFATGLIGSWMTFTQLNLASAEPGLVTGILIVSTLSFIACSLFSYTIARGWSVRESRAGAAAPARMHKAAGAPVVSLHGVSVRYGTGEQWIGTGIDLDTAADETVLLLGPSGCGKSTLLLAMAGLIPASVDADVRGSITCAGIDTALAHPGQLAAHVGVVFQDPDAQVVTSSLLDEVCFGLEHLLVPAAEIEDRALAALRQVGAREHPR